MRKVRLDPYALAVESFDVGRGRTEGGTVVGHEVTRFMCDPNNSVGVCPDTNTCAETCPVTCAATCFDCTRDPDLC